MSNVVDLSNYTPHSTVIAVCLACRYTWQALVRAKTVVTELECSECHAQDSLAIGVLQDYTVLIGYKDKDGENVVWEYGEDDA